MKQQSNQTIQEELKEMHSSLANLKRDNPFRTPVDYFESLPDDLMRRIQAEASLWPTEAPVTKSKPVRFSLSAWLIQWRFQLGVLGVFLAAALYFLLLPTSSDTNSAVDLAQLEAAEIKQYVSNNIDDFSMEMLLEAAIVESDDVHTFDVLEGLDENTLDQLMNQMLDDMDLNDLDEIF